MDNPIDGIDGKLGHGFTSADELEEIDIGSRNRPKPTYVSAKLDPIDKISSIALRGVSLEGRLIGRDVYNQEQEGNRNTRVRQVRAISTT